MGQVPRLIIVLAVAIALIGAAIGLYALKKGEPASVGPNRSAAPAFVTSQPVPAAEGLHSPIKEGECPKIITDMKKLVAAEPKNTDAWLREGICEFQSAKSQDAKNSFGKVLALDPQNRAAKTYLGLLADSEKISPQVLGKKDFESRLGVSLDSAALTFVSALSLPAGPNRSASAAATYASDRNAEETMSALAKYFEKNGFSVNAAAYGDQMSLSGSKGQINVSASLPANTVPVRVTILYEVLK